VILLHAVDHYEKDSLVHLFDIYIEYSPIWGRQTETLTPKSRDLSYARREEFVVSTALVIIPYHVVKNRFTRKAESIVTCDL